MDRKLSEIKMLIDPEMKTFQEYFKKSMKTDIPLLTLIVQFLLKRKGKQIRPMFVFLSAKMFHDVNHSTYVAANLIELLHTATLIHDDVVDDSYQRRGFFSIKALWKSKISVLMGDFLLAKGLLLAVKNKEYELLDIVSEAVKEMSEGEILQIQKNRKSHLTREEYFDIIRKKTATLFSACTKCGAKSVEADEATLQKMSDFGENAGIAFQIKDDLFDYDLNGKIGKPTGNDLKDSKTTLPLILALENAGNTERKKVKKIVNNKKLRSSQIQYVNRFVKENKGLELAHEEMIKYKTKAESYLSGLPENNIKAGLTGLLDYIIYRKK